ncbi:MAG: hypothetical protein EOP88_03825 [Verrucomicrobiaceae bacterium]|nr:MAG: hypothetical protein EOP88_03825 [Verrucomicrobiaceae bacterium]
MLPPAQGEVPQLKMHFLKSKRSLLGCIFTLVLGALPVEARIISFFCNPMSVNQTASGASMDGSFRFELGVFTGGFVPTSANTSQWAANWVSAKRAVYNETNRLFTAEHTVTSNAAPFTTGALAYVWGFGGTRGDEWILFRATTWLWPTANPENPVLINWNASAATQVIVGSINSSGSPYRMRTATISASVPPATTWSQWQAESLEGVALNGPSQDADGDGIRNDFEFVFGLDPRRPDTLPPTLTEVATLGNERFLRIGIPRRADRLASLVVQVSPNLTSWSSGPAYTLVDSSAPSLLTVRSLVPIDGTTPRQFMRTGISVTP